MVCHYHQAARPSALRHLHYKETSCAAVNMPVVRSLIRRKIRDALRTVQPNLPRSKAICVALACSYRNGCVCRKAIPPVLLECPSWIITGSKSNDRYIP